VSVADERVVFDGSRHVIDCLFDSALSWSEVGRYNGLTKIWAARPD
jgi:hypothetical protein